jgi:hypothetical protein
METTKALEILKALIDESIKKGVIGNIETAVQVAQAFDTIVKEIQKTASSNES